MITALCSMMNDRFYIAFDQFIKSLRTNNAWILTQKIPFIIIDLGVSFDNKEKMRKLYPYLDFRTPNYGEYSSVDFSKTPSVLKCTYYKLDMFSYSDVNRLVFIDLDTTVCGDISHLFQREEPISMCHGYNRNADALRSDFNSGVLVLNKDVLSTETYKGLIKTGSVGYSMPDQKTIWLYFRDKISVLPKKYNCEKRMKDTKNFIDEWNDRRILHWISEKPWNDKKEKINMGYEELEKVWYRYYEMDVFLVGEDRGKKDIN